MCTFTCCFRLHCALEGKYLVRDHADVMGGAESFNEQAAEIQTLNFNCAIKNFNGRGFVEVISRTFSLTADSFL